MGWSPPSEAIINCCRSAIVLVVTPHDGTIAANRGHEVAGSVAARCNAQVRAGIELLLARYPLGRECRGPIY